MMDISKYLKFVFKYRFFVVVVLLGGMFAYSLYKLTFINQPTIDEQYLREQQAAAITEIKIDPNLRQELERLVETNVDTKPDQLGNEDPFNP